jgi:ligand-binding sensor domain-containing protein/signal transduction histidine kinase
MRFASEPLRMALALAAMATATPALDPGKPPSQYSQARWQVDAGLPDNYVQTLLPTRDGYLWLGTTEGLVRFDGMRFAVFDTRNTAALRHNSVVALCQDRTGALWVGTSGGGIAVYRDGQFVASYDVSKGLPNNYIRSIYEDRDGAIWITAHAGGLVRFRNGRFEAITMRDGLPSDSLRVVLQDSEGTLWVGTDEDGICRMRGGSLECFGRDSGLRSRQIRALFQDSKGRIWAGTRAGGLHRFDGRRFRPVPLAAEIPAAAVRAILEDRQGNLWVGTEGAGLLRLRGEQVSRLTTREGLPHNFVRALAEDREGNLWLGTRGGLFRLRDKKVETWTTNEGLINDDARALLADAAGRVWIGTRAGLNLIENGAVHTIRLTHEWTRDVVRSLAATPGDSIWIGADTGLFRWKNGSVTAVPLPEAAPVRVVLARRGGELWVALWNRLLLMDAGGFRDVSSSLSAPLEGINAMAEDRKGRLWIGTEQGLLSFDGRSTVRYTSRDGLAHDRITSLHVDKDNVLWIATRGGLTRFASGEWRVFRRRDGLLSDNVLHVSEDRQGHLWLTSRRGITRIDKRELQAFAEGRISELHPVSFDTSDGMRSAECNGEAQPAGAMTPDGRMWFPTVAGVVVFDPQNLRAAPAPPRVVIERIIAGQKAWQVWPRPLRVRPGSGSLWFEFTAISLSAPERVRFRYRLEGYDTDWTETERDRTAYYANLRPGNYRFRVLADAKDGSWPREEASAEIVLEPHFHQTVAFYLLCAAAMAALAAAAYRARMITLRRRYEAVLEERARIAREIHDTLMQGVTGVSLQLDSAARRLPAEPQEAKRRMDRALARLDEVVAEARRTILELRSNGQPSSLEQPLLELARILRAEYGIEMEFLVEGSRGALPETLCRHLVSIAREAVFNAVRHSGASRIRLRVEHGRGAVRLVVADNGCGFDATRSAHEHFGLTGMRERANSLGGKLEIHSSPGAGTTVEAELPLES